MGKLRLRFAKEDRAVYISHLDLLRTFQRVFLREGLVVRHSQGFHPHPILSFALPLSVGQSSICELLDFEVEEALDGQGMAEALNRYMPEGIRALECYVPVRPVRELAKLSCEVDFLYDAGVPDNAGEQIAELLARESVMIQKRTKRKTLADIDIRPLLHSLEVTEEHGFLRLNALASAQNPGMNPALLAAAVERHAPALKADFVRVRRLETLDESGGIFR